MLARTVRSAYSLAVLDLRAPQDSCLRKKFYNSWIRSCDLMESLWQTLTSKLEQTFPGQHVSCWLQDAHITFDDPHTVTLYVPNRFSQKWIEHHYVPQLVQELRTVTGKQELKVVVEVSATDGRTAPEKMVGGPALDKEAGDAFEFQAGKMSGSEAARALSEHDASSVVDSSGLNQKYRFTNFIVGDSNRLAWTAAQEVCRTFQSSYNPFYVYSPTGLGKTHLGQAMANFLLESSRGLKIQWRSAEALCSELMHHLRNKSLRTFKDRCRQECDVFCVDDIQFLKGKPWIQTELCYTIDALLNQGKRVLLFGQVAPNDGEGFSDDLTSRIFSGLSAKIHHPNKDTRIAILRFFAAQAGVSLSDRALETIAETVTTHIRNLEGAFTRIVAMSSLLKRPIDPALVTEALKDFREKGPALLDMETIAQHVIRYFHLDEETLTRRSRKQRIYYCRQIAMYLSRKYTSESLDAIGAFYKRDHATVFHAIRSLQQKMKTSASVRREVKFLEEKLLETHGLDKG